jgi:hypothetical protein
LRGDRNLYTKVVLNDNMPVDDSQPPHLETQSARILVNPTQTRCGLHCIPVRPAKLATTVMSSAGSTGLTTCD